MLLMPKRRIDEPNMKWGIVVWQLPNGKYVQDSEGNYLVAGPCTLNSRIAAEAESKMRKSARSLGIREGQPFWLPGFRKITDAEHDDQMERLLDGKIPDLVDLARQADANGQS